MPAQHRPGHKTRDHVHKVANAHQELTDHAHRKAAEHYAQEPPPAPEPPAPPDALPL